MRKFVVAGVFISLSLLVLFVLVRVFHYANSVQVFSDGVSLGKDNQDLSLDVGSQWTKELANVKDRTHFAVVNNLFISSKLQKVILDTQRVYQLVIDKADRYSLFCIDRILVDNKVSYSVTKDSKQLAIYVVSQNKQMLDTIVRELKKYDINSKVKEVTKI